MTPGRFEPAESGNEKIFPKNVITTLIYRGSPLKRGAWKCEPEVHVRLTH